MCSTSLLAFSLLCGLSTARPQDRIEPEWLWVTAEASPRQRAWFQRSFDLRGEVSSAQLWTSCDNELELVVNGVEAAENQEWAVAVNRDISEYLKSGAVNSVVAQGKNEDGPAGFWFELDIEFTDGSELRIVSDDTWRVSASEPKGWRQETFDPEAFGAWRAPVSFGILGGGPWGSPTGFTDGRPPRALPAEEIELARGFEAELVYTVPRKLQGSWVSIAPGPNGTLFTSDQYGGIYEVRASRFGEGATTTSVRELPLEVGQAQGLLWAFDSLYFVGGTGGAGSGLYRATDSDADGKLDRVELLQALDGGGEHGPHAVRLAPDGESLYVIAGNHTDLPPLAASRVPLVWGEDQLLPRTPDPRGHGVGVEAPGGWLCRVDPDGKNWELFACGMRNAYDFAIGNDGEIFTFDSDMEWDVGLPWYRPTRVLHLVSGADYGWRHGSGKWPASYPDSWPAVVDVGLASPTGVEFAPQSFPAKWRDRLLIADWTHGTLYGVDLVPQGATFRGQVELLAKGKPLQFTDLCVGADGAIYFTTGGRRTQSALYRIRSTHQSPAQDDVTVERPGSALQDTRKELEALHSPLARFAERTPEPVLRLDKIWDHLGSEDRFVRQAARVALEHMPEESWRRRALSAKDPVRSIQALIALARCGESPVRAELLESFLALPLEDLSPQLLIEAMRLYGLIAIRHGPWTEAERLRLLRKVTPLWTESFTGEPEDPLREVFRVLVHLQSPDLVQDAFFPLETSATQDARAFYLFTLRHLKGDWHPNDRERYLMAFREALTTFKGGASLIAYLENARDEFFEGLPLEERERLAPLLEPAGKRVTESVAIPSNFVRAWSMDDFANQLDQDWSRRDLERGKTLYERATCTTCHRFDGTGGNTGPDLTAAGSRFSARDLLLTILEPNFEVSDQYQDMEILTHDDELFIGRIEEETDEVVVILTLPPEEASFEIDRDEIALRRPHPLSRMPAGLVDTLKRDEVLDLLGYLITGEQE